MSSGSLIMDKPSPAVSFLPIKTELELNSHEQTSHLQVSLHFFFNLIFQNCVILVILDPFL